ncbi:MAG: tail protein X [Acidaminococcaceae bacterium]|nr:tail protein X [Acidaminococcaceae bacterium]
MSKTYTTKQGDMWDGIAKVLYGTEKAMNVLLEANQQYDSVVVFGANIVLTVPDYTAPKSDLLPPWRR